MNWVRCFILMMIVSGNLYASERYPFDSEEKKAQFNGLIKELRCVVCQNQNLADSNASIANNMRQVVYEKVQQGETDDAIMRFLTDRYGNFILFRPPLTSITWLLWFAPIIFLLLGLGIYLYAVFFRRRPS